MIHLSHKIQQRAVKHTVHVVLGWHSTRLISRGYAYWLALVLQLLTVRVAINHTNLIKMCMKFMEKNLLVIVNKMQNISELIKTGKDMMTFCVI